MMGISFFFEMFLAWGEFYSNSPVASICRIFPGFHQVLVVKVIEQGLQSCNAKQSKKGLCHSTLTARNRHKSMIIPQRHLRNFMTFQSMWVKRWVGEQTRGLGNGKGERYLPPLSTHHQKSDVLNTQTKRQKELDKSTLHPFKFHQIKRPFAEKNLFTIWAISTLAGCMSNIITRSKRRGIKFHSDGCAGIFSMESDFQMFWHPPPLPQCQSHRRGPGPPGPSSPSGPNWRQLMWPNCWFLGGNNRNDSKTVRKTPKSFDSSSTQSPLQSLTLQVHENWGQVLVCRSNHKHVDIYIYIRPNRDVRRPDSTAF